MSAADPLVLRPHRAGDIGWVIHRHGALYHQEFGWDIGFEALVARIGADFIESYDPARMCCRIAERGDRIVGSAFVVPDGMDTAKLRLVYVEPGERGQGTGRQLVEACMAFARAAGYQRMTLWTHDILVDARRLYQRLGFALTASEPITAFGQSMISETWARNL